MSRTPFGWDLPPGVSHRDLEGGEGPCRYCNVGECADCGQGMEEHSDLIVCSNFVEPEHVCQTCAVEIAADERFDRERGDE